MKDIHILETDCLRVEVSDTGAELVRVLDKEKGTERLWNADPEVWNRHAPLLFPFVGKVTDGKYRINGKEYDMPTQHGFARDLVFSCFEESTSAVVHSLSASAETQKSYPWDFLLTVRHSLDPWQPRRLRIAWTVENIGTDRMYYAIGGHPGFLMPPGVPKEECFLLFPGREALCYFSSNGKGFALPENRHTLALTNGAVRYQQDIPLTWIFEDQAIDTVGIAGPDGTAFVTMHCQGFPMLAVWSNSAGNFICLEPWYGRTDDLGFTGTLAQKKGIQTLTAGEKKNYSYEIDFH